MNMRMLLLLLNMLMARVLAIVEDNDADQYKVAVVLFCCYCY